MTLAELTCALAAINDRHATVFCAPEDHHRVHMTMSSFGPIDAKVVANPLIDPGTVIIAPGRIEH